MYILAGKHVNSIFFKYLYICNFKQLIPFAIIIISFLKEFLPNGFHTIEIKTENFTCMLESLLGESGAHIVLKYAVSVLLCYHYIGFFFP